MESKTKSTMSLYGLIRYMFIRSDSAKGLTVSPHSLSNKLSIKSVTMGSMGVQAALFRFCIGGEAAIMFSISTFAEELTSYQEREELPGGEQQEIY